MISKIIQKEKETQNICLEPRAYDSASTPRTRKLEIKRHEQSLINLKEYIEEQYKEIFDNPTIYQGETKVFSPRDGCKLNQLKEDIEELTKMIGRYE